MCTGSAVHDDVTDFKWWTLADSFQTFLPASINSRSGELPRMQVPWSGNRT